MKDLLKKYKKLIIIIFALAFLLIYYNIFYLNAEKNSEVTSPISETMMEEDVHESLSDHDTEKCNSTMYIIYITGAIGEPGVYEVPSNFRWIDVITQCGGLLPYANTSKINLSAPIQDGAHLHIDFNFYGDPTELLRKNKININVADENELIKIKGIGPSTAKRIIEYRTEHGKFHSVEDIKNVKGIGDGTYKKMKEFICV